MHMDDHRLAATLQITSVDPRKLSAFGIIIHQQQKTLMMLWCVFTPGSSPPFNGRGSLFPLLLFPLFLSLQRGFPPSVPSTPNGITRNYLCQFSLLPCLIGEKQFLI